MLAVIREYFPEKTVLVLDNDLSSEFGHSYGLDIRNTMEYSEDAKYFTLPSKPNIRYCSTCYGYDGKLIPMTKGDRGYLCRVCEEIWMEKGTKR